MSVSFFTHSSATAYFILWVDICEQIILWIEPPRSHWIINIVTSFKWRKAVTGLGHVTLSHFVTGAGVTIRQHLTAHRHLNYDHSLPSANTRDHWPVKLLGDTLFVTACKPFMTSRGLFTANGIHTTITTCPDNSRLSNITLGQISSSQLEL